MVVGEKCPVTIKCGEGLLSQLLAFDPQGGFPPKQAFSVRSFTVWKYTSKRAHRATRLHSAPTIRYESGNKNKTMQKPQLQIKLLYLK